MPERRTPQSPRDPLSEFRALLAALRAAGDERALRHLITSALETVPAGEFRAELLLYLGQSHERTRDYQGAVPCYRGALAEGPAGEFTAYFVRNNLAYCLSRFGRHAEAEELCREASGLAPGIPNAWKNLGLALAGQGKAEDAFDAFVVATRLGRGDRRAVDLMEGLVVERPELLESEDVRERLAWCRKMAGGQGRAAPDAPG